MPNDLGTVLLEGVALLRDLPRQPDDVPAAQQRIAEWGASHPGLQADLLIDHPPGSIRVDYDLLLGLVESGRRGTLGLTWREDDGVPWSVSYAEHWAANAVVTVNGQSVTIRQALRLLRLTGLAIPDLTTELVNQRLVLQALDQDAVVITDEDVQEAADQFRWSHGLHSAADMRRWLKEAGLPDGQFAEAMEAAARLAKLKRRIVGERLDAHFAAHRETYARVRLHEAQVPTEDLARQLASEARTAGLLAALDGAFGKACASWEATLATRHAASLPSIMRTATPGTVVGPYRRGKRYAVAEVLERHEPALDDVSRAVVEDAVYQEWLAERRAAARVEWHWS